MGEVKVEDTYQEIVEENRKRRLASRADSDAVYNAALAKCREDVAKIGTTETVLSREIDEGQKDLEKRFKRMRDRSRQSDERIDRAAKGFYDEMDRISAMRDVTLDTTDKVLEKNGVLDSAIIDETLQSELVTVADLEGLGPNYTPDKLEAVLTNFTIDLMGIDASKIPETEKLKWAKLIWGREAIIAKMQEGAKAKGVTVSKGEVRERCDNLIYGMATDLPLSPEELRDRVTNIAFAYGSEEGHKKMIQMAIAWEQERMAKKS